MQLAETPDKRGRGRPPIEDGEQSTSINVRVPNRMYDEAHKIASRDRVTVPELVRRAIQHLIQDERG